MYVLACVVGLGPYTQTVEKRERHPVMCDSLEVCVPQRRKVLVLGSKCSQTINALSQLSTQQAGFITPTANKLVASGQLV